MPRGVYPRTEEHKRRIAESLKGHSVSEETRQKMSESHRGHSPSEEHRRRNAEGVRRSWTSEKREAQSERSTAMWQNQDHLTHMAEIRRGMNGKEEARGWCVVGGYRVLSGHQGHPLAHLGNVAEHRKVLYDEIGPGPHLCHWGCGKLLTWGGRSGIQADHLDGDKLHNELSNLVPSCIGCNRRRALAGNPVDWRPPSRAGVVR